MKYTVKGTAVLACAALMIGSVSLTASTPKVQAMGLPNPIVTYDTYESVVKDAGFTPLYLTRDAGFSCYYLSLIGKNTADIGFQRLGQPETTVRVRTMPQKADKSIKDISGIYSVTWKDQVIDGVTVSIAKISDTSYAAHWKVGDYQFSARATGMSAPEFKAILENSLVDNSAHYFVK